MSTYMLEAANVPKEKSDKEVEKKRFLFCFVFTHEC